MKLQIMNAVLFLSLTQLSFAASSIKPNSCPSVSALQSVGILDVIKENGLWYGGVKSNNYDTKDKWTFAIGAFKAANKNEAKKQALNAVNSLTFDKGPIDLNVAGHESWICLYKDSSGHTGGAITPPMGYLQSWMTR